MKVFLSFLLLSVMAGILMRHRPYYQSQIVVAVLTGIAAICYFVFGML